MVDGKKPVFSMTGFGAGEARITGGRVRVEVKSVNHRYLDVTVKGPREYVSLETRVLEAVRARLKRGKVDVFVTRAVDPGESGAVKANVPLARGWKD
ncbi:MAG TPA: YicC/YloC family endoribonuclease, partial [bacterium]|nr:YicC/YloC family endoribonuclease [bacterium]